MNLGMRERQDEIQEWQIFWYGKVRTTDASIERCHLKQKRIKMPALKNGIIFCQYSVVCKRQDIQMNASNTDDTLTNSICRSNIFLQQPKALKKEKRELCIILTT